MKIADYKALIQAFLENKMTEAEFETRYLAAFKAETAIAMEMFFILDRLFTDVDAYYPDYTPGEKTDSIISEKSLRMNAAKALAKLEQVEQKNPAL